MTLPTSGLVTRHYRHLATLSPLPFIIRAGLEAVAVSMLVMLVAIAVRPNLANLSTDESDRTSFAILVLIAPLIETLLFQWFPVWLTRLFTQRFAAVVIAGWLPFAMMHFFNDPLSGISALAGGYYMGFSYAIWVRRSHGKAILVTFAVHALNNLLSWILTRFF